jgi:hypothetical protein
VWTSDRKGGREKEAWLPFHCKGGSEKGRPSVVGVKEVRFGVRPEKVKGGGEG